MLYTIFHNIFCFRNYLQVGVFALLGLPQLSVCLCSDSWIWFSFFCCKGRHSKPHSSQKMKLLLSISFIVSLCLSHRFDFNVCVCVSVFATFSVICLDYFVFVWLHTCRGLILQLFPLYLFLFFSNSIIVRNKIKKINLSAFALIALQCLCNAFD